MAQIGELFDAIGAGGISLIVTLVVPIGPVHPLTVTNTEYIPVAKVLAPAIVGFCNSDENAFGPLQL